MRSKQRHLLSRSVTWACVACVVCMSAAWAVQARVIEREAAVVDKQIILLSELQARTDPFEVQLQRIADSDQREQRRAEMRMQGLDQMIDEKLIAQEAAKLQLEVSEEDLERAVNEVMRRNNLSKEQLEAALLQEGKSLLEYRQQILRPQLLRLKVLNVQVRSRVSVREDEIKALYQQNVRSLGVESKVRARHIFIHIPPDMRPEDAAKRRALARQLRRRLGDGADFDALARKHSEDSVTAPEGGDLGYISRGTLPADIEDHVFKMKIGQIRGPLPSARGLHLLQVTDRQESAAKPYKEVRESLRMQLLNEKTEKATRSWLKELRKRAYVDIKLQTSGPDTPAGK